MFKYFLTISPSFSIYRVEGNEDGAQGARQVAANPERGKGGEENPREVHPQYRTRAVLLRQGCVPSKAVCRAHRRTCAPGVQDQCGRAP
ncbi:hypothetical protein ATCV1_z312R [Acanthocystis turfacea chlorella virus 1]|uniref:Uncharacterized protein z312R n=1 Tax=Chlorovirus heliozoae TaxID=322019 RepID=A7K8S2_9PHYC|nr:hypothetical protein ATCV1_z312R [Acanthocystis turfacea chlorella virus 1]ABT16446.1 hypothetical protein ATCV1_z312R [Acanthocystis turfacea chlorella virus 1]